MYEFVKKHGVNTIVSTCFNHMVSQPHQVMQKLLQQVMLRLADDEDLISSGSLRQSLDRRTCCDLFCLWQNFKV